MGKSFTELCLFAILVLESALNERSPPHSRFQACTEDNGNQIYHMCYRENLASPFSSRLSSSDNRRNRFAIFCLYGFGAKRIKGDFSKTCVSQIVFKYLKIGLKCLIDVC